MSGDDRELRRMLEQYRDERAPGSGVQERVWNAVAVELASNAGSESSGSGAPKEAPSALAPRLARPVVLVTLLAVGAATWMLLGADPQPASPKPTPSTVPAAPASASPHSTPALAPPPTLAVPTPAAAATAPLAPRSSVPPRVPPSTLAIELALLTRAQTALDAGHDASAFATLRRHARRFPSGALAEERDAALVEVLCRLGRTREARRAADAFGQRFPASPRAARVLSLCTAEPGR